jgi:hypothetical protein
MKKKTMNKDFLDLFFFDDEAWFRLSGLCELTKYATVKHRKSTFLSRLAIKPQKNKRRKMRIYDS